MPDTERKPIFQIEASFLDYFITTILLIGSVIGVITFLVEIWFTGWKNVWFALFCVGAFFYIRRGVREFLLFDDKLIVTRPLLFSRKSDDVFFVSDIREVTFVNIKGRFGGPHMVIRCKKRMHESYGISFSRETLNEFRNALGGTGVLIINKGM